MNQNQCVPSWELDGVASFPPQGRAVTSRPHSTSFSTDPDISMLDFEVAELKWKNGQLAMHVLGLPRESNHGGAWTYKASTRASGTLESIVNQSAEKPPPSPQGGTCDDHELVPCFNPDHCPSAATPGSPVSMTMDAIVPNNNRGPVEAGGCSTLVGSFSASARVPGGSVGTVSSSGCTTWRDHMVNRPARDTCEHLGDGNNWLTTSTSFDASPENTKTITVDEHDSFSLSLTRQRGQKEENNEKGNVKSSVSKKRSRKTDIHNQSERRRRDKINQRMKTLQKLVPNSSKTGKASVLDEVIDYLKQLQAQVQMMSRMMCMSSMIMPMAPMPMQQQLHMSLMGMGMGMGMGMEHMNTSINSSMARPSIAGISTAVLNPSTFVPLASSGDPLPPQTPMVVPPDPLSAYLACQPATMDAYNRMAATYQQQLQRLLRHHQQQSHPAGSNT